MSELQFDQDLTYARQPSFQNQTTPSLFYSVIIKIGLAKDEQGAQKILVVLVLIGIMASAYLFYSAANADKKYPFTPEQFKVMKDRMEHPEKFTK